MGQVTHERRQDEQREWIPEVGDAEPQPAEQQHLAKAQPAPGRGVRHDREPALTLLISDGRRHAASLAPNRAICYGTNGWVARRSRWWAPVTWARPWPSALPSAATPIWSWSTSSRGCRRAKRSTCWRQGRSSATTRRSSAPTAMTRPPARAC